MKFALVDSNKLEAIKGVKGVCPSCGSELIAKCGTRKINHWAHKGTLTCDPWWENETEWHRLWKNNFSTEWQEYILYEEQTGEKHIADIRTDHGLVIELQHSHIDPEEQAKREKFYKNMIWIVDGSRLKRDFSRFQKATVDFQNAHKQGFYFVENIEWCFPANWINSSVPVIFDFKDLEIVNDQIDLKNYLYCLYPKSYRRKSLIVKLNRQPFIDFITNGDFLNELKISEKMILEQQSKIDRINSQNLFNSLFNRGSKQGRGRF